MTLTDAEVGYLEAQGLGRLATIQPDGSPPGEPHQTELKTRDLV